VLFREGNILGSSEKMRCGGKTHDLLFASSSYDIQLKDAIFLLVGSSNGFFEPGFSSVVAVVAAAADVAVVVAGNVDSSRTPDTTRLSQLNRLKSLLLPLPLILERSL